MTIAMHTCRGNFKSAWVAEGGYEPVAEAMFSAGVDAFFMEFDTERAGGFEPLRFVPRGKKVVLGLVSSKTPKLETKDELKRRIDQAAKYVPLENLCLSPQCGFSSTHHGNQLTADEQWKKLERVVEVAREDRALGHLEMHAAAPGILHLRRRRPVVLHVLADVDGRHAGHRARRAAVDGSDAGVRAVGAQEGAVELAREIPVGGVAAFAFQEPRVFAPPGK